MAHSEKGTHVPSIVQLSYQLIRNTTSPDEKECGVRSFIANLPASEVLKVDTQENLRSYLAEYSSRKRNRVHEAIRLTIDTNPQRFITRNGGVVITVSEIDVDDRKRIVSLHNASIVNGSQTQGEIRRYFEDLEEYNDSDSGDIPFFVRAEIIVDSDPDQVVETAIARNTATPVKSISQAGARGQLNDLEESIRDSIPDIQIQKKETDQNVSDTRKILQYCRLLMPEVISKRNTPAERLRPYKNPEQCLTEFTDWFEHRHHKDRDEAAKYWFTVQIAPSAIREYEYWEAHEAWNGHKIWEQTQKGGRVCRRDPKGKVVWMSPGVIFPIMGAMSAFVRKDPSADTWTIDKPNDLFRDEEMVERAVAQFRAHDSDPMAMGRSEGAYDALRIYPNTLIEVLRNIHGSK